jgi:hypothetical protein
MDLVTEQLQESGYVVIPDVVGIEEIKEIARGDAGEARVQRICILA